MFLSPVGDLERLGVVARAVARRAGCVGAGQEEQLDGDESLALAGLAAALGDVEGEAARAVAAGLRLVRCGVQLAHGVEHPRVRREVRPRRPADRPLVDEHQPVERLERTAGSSGEHLADQRRLAGAGHPGDGGQHAERDVDRHVAQVVAGARRPAATSPAGHARRARAARRDRTGRRWWPTRRRPRDRRPGRCRARGRRPRPRPDRCRRPSPHAVRRRGRARRRTASCRTPSGGPAHRAAAPRRPGAGRRRARRGRRRPRTARSAAGWRSAAAASHRATASSSSARG